MLIFISIDYCRIIIYITKINKGMVLNKILNNDYISRLKYKN